MHNTTAPSPYRQIARAQERQKTARSPILGTRPTRPAGRPGLFAPAGLRRFTASPWATKQPEDLSMRFLRHDGIYQSDGGPNPSSDRSHCLPPAAPNPSPTTRREDHVVLIVPMSSDRIFLDGLLASIARLRFTGTARLTWVFWTQPETGHFYFARKRTFLLCSDSPCFLNVVSTLVVRCN